MLFLNELRHLFTYSDFYINKIVFSGQNYNFFLLPVKLG